MKIAMLDGTRVRKTQLQELLVKNKYDVTACRNSNDFLNVVTEGNADILLIDMETWSKGKSVYNYFSVPKKLEKKTVVFYNAEEGFSALPERTNNEKDQIVRKPSELQAVVDAIHQAM